MIIGPLLKFHGTRDILYSDAGVVVHPVRSRQQRASDRSCVPRCQVFLMVSRQPHADVAILVLHGSDVGRETFLTSQRWPVRPVVGGRSGLPLGMLGVAPAWAGCGGHACSLRQPHGRMRIGGGASGSGTTRVLDKSLAESPATITGQRSPRRMCRSDLRCPSLPTNREHAGHVRGLLKELVMVNDRICRDEALVVGMVGHNAVRRWRSPR